MDATPRPARTTRRALALGLAVVASTGLLLGAGASTGAAPAQAASASSVVGDGTSAGRSYDLVNAARAADGLAPLAISPDATRVASDWASHMAAGRSLAHNPALSRQLSGWALVAENVGVGADADQLHDAFMASAGHRANVLRENVTEMGVGSFRSGDGRLWIVQVFELPAGVTAPARGAATAPEAQPFTTPVSAASSFTAAPALVRHARGVA